MSPMRNRVLNIEQWLQEQTKSPKATRAALQCFVMKNLSEWSNSLPVDPSLFAKKLGCDVLVEDVPSARLEVTRFSKIIRVPKNAPSHLQRFSMAHELAHLLFLKLDDNGVSRAYADEASDSPDGQVRMNARNRLERYCDVAAGMILVPRSAIEETLPKGERVNLDLLLALAARFDVLPSVLFERLVDCERLSRYPGHVLLRYCENRFTRRDKKWRVTARALPRSEFFTQFPWPNQSFGSLPIKIPPPDNAVCDSSVLLEVRGQRWNCEIQSAKRDASWALARFTLANKEGTPVPRSQ